MNIYVGNLNYNLSTEELQQAFEEYGTVTSVKIIMDRDTGKSKGFGFVEMEDDDAGNTAIEELNGAEIGGRELRVNKANDRERKPRRDNFRG